MEKQKPPEFDPDLLASIPPEKREEFKTIARKKRYLGSGQFFFMWHFCLWGLMIPISALIHILVPAYGLFMENQFAQWSFLIEAFFFMILLGLATKSIRHRLNQNGIHAIHFFFISFPIIYVTLYYLNKLPGRSY
jgi:hypothetical protein